MSVTMADDTKEKRPPGSRVAFWMFYCAESDPVEGSGILVGGTGAVVGLVGVICSVRPLPPVLTEGLITFMINANTLMAITNPHVPFSKMSPVRFTPMRLVLPENPEA